MSDFQKQPEQQPQGGQPGPYGQPAGGAPQASPYGAPQGGPYAPQPGGAPQGGQPGYAPVPAGGGGMPATAAGTGSIMRRRGPGAVWGLMLITLSIYGFVRWYGMQKELNAFDRRIEVKPGMSVLALIPGGWLIVPPFISVYNTGNRIREAQRAAGLPETCSPAMGCLLSILLNAHLIHYQSEINKITERYGNPPEFTQVPLAA